MFRTYVGLLAVMLPSLILLSLQLTHSPLTDESQKGRTGPHRKCTLLLNVVSLPSLFKSALVWPPHVRKKWRMCVRAHVCGIIMDMVVCPSVRQAKIVYVCVCEPVYGGHSCGRFSGDPIVLCPLSWLSPYSCCSAPEGKHTHTSYYLYEDH